MKKKTGVINSLKMIHGNSLEVVENRILSARTALIDATNDLQELFTVSRASIIWYICLVLQ